MIPLDTPLERLVAGTKTCLGATFLSYTFDPTFFEEEILATLLGIMSDPEESPRMFLNEATQKLQQIPVAVMVDPGHIQGGRRLPYDLLPAGRERLFHPKLSFILYKDMARVSIGSGNLTPGGYGGNAEVGAVLTLRYDEDAKLIRELTGFLDLCHLRGEAWERFLDTLNHLLGPEQEMHEDEPRFFHSLAHAPMLDQVLDAIPEDARVLSVGILAPFHQEDGAQPERAVFDRLIATLGPRCKGKLPLDIGLAWDQNPIGPKAEEQPSLDSGTGRLWALEAGAPRRASSGWFVLGAREGWNRRCDFGASTRLLSTRELNQAIADERAWCIEEVEVAGPKGLVERAQNKARLALFVHPEIRKEEGSVLRQPLHAKLLCVAIGQGRKKSTLLLVGSPNASAKALLERNGNIECAILMRLEGHHRLADLCPTLVPCPYGQVRWHERSYQESPPNPARWLDDAWYEADTKALTFTWKEEAPILRLSYTQPDGTLLRLFEGRASNLRKTIRNFELRPGNLELVVEAEGTKGHFPIRVIRLLDLPVIGEATQWSFDELVGLYAGRYSMEGLHRRRTSASAAGQDLGEGAAGVWRRGLAPREVFRALHAIAREITNPDISPGAFTMLTEGPAGLASLGRQLLAAADSEDLRGGEAWIFGHELIRELTVGDQEEGPFMKERRRWLDEFSIDLREHLTRFSPSGPIRKPLVRFYRRHP